MAREVKMGREAERDVEKEHKLVTDLAAIERVERIGNSIAAVANSVTVEAGYGSPDVYQFEYKFKIIEDEGINAFSLPGGIVYVNKGLLDYCQSDHELAGVLAHEAAHAAHHHMVHLLREQSKLDGQIALLLLAGMVARVDSTDLGNLLIGAQLVRIARTSGYGRKAETDADTAAVTYMAQSGYNPVGLLTFLERLARDAATKPDLNMGIMQTHPAPRDRCRNVTSEIKSLGLPLNRRAVTDSLKARTEATTVNGQSITRVTLGDQVLFDPAPVDNALTSEQRAQAITVKVNQFLDSDPKFREVRLSSDGGTVLARGEPVIMVFDQDAVQDGKPTHELAQHAADVLKRAIWCEMIARIY